MLSNQTPNVEIRIWLARGSAIEREAGVAAQPLECQLIARRKPPRLPFLTTVAVIWSDRLIDRSTSEALRILAENAHPFSAGLVGGRRTSGNGFRFLYTGRRFVASAIKRVPDGHSQAKGTRAGWPTLQHAPRRER